MASIVAGVPSGIAGRLVAAQCGGDLLSPVAFLIWCSGKDGRMRATVPKFSLKSIVRTGAEAGGNIDPAALAFVTSRLKFGGRSQFSTSDLGVIRELKELLHEIEEPERAGIDRVVQEAMAALTAAWNNSTSEERSRWAGFSLAREYFILTGAEAGHPEPRSFVQERLSWAFHKRKSNFQGRSRYFDPGEAFRQLTALKDAFDAHGKRFFLVSGTLLGVMRNGDFLESEYDIDLGVLEDEVTMHQLRAICALCPGLSIAEAYSDSERLTLFTESGIEVEFYLHRVSGEFFQLKTDVHIWHYSRFGLKEVEFRGNSFNVPDDTERYLKENYGNWEVPVGFFDFSFDTPNRIYRDNIHGLFYLGERLQNAILYGRREGSSHASNLLYDYFDIDYRWIIPRNEAPQLPPVVKRIQRYHPDYSDPRAGAVVGEAPRSDAPTVMFTPGPVQMYEQDIEAGALQPPYFRNQAFSDLLKSCERRLLQLTKATDGSRVVFLSASGTGAMEAAALNFTSLDTYAFVLEAGVFGSRFSHILSAFGRPHSVAKIDAGTGFVDQVIAQYQKVSAVFCTANETSTGALNNVRNFFDAVQRDENAFLIVDGISSFLCDPIDMAAIGIDVLILASQKALALPPGLAFLVLSPRAVEFCLDKANEDGAPRNVFYFDLAHYLRDGIRGQTPFTPPVGIIAQLDGRLRRLVDAGVDEVVAQTQERAAYFRKRLSESDLPFSVFSEPPSSGVTALRCTDPRINAEVLVRHFTEKYGIFLTPNGGDLRNNVFRVSHMGKQNHSGLDLIIDKLRAYCAHLGI